MNSHQRRKAHRKAQRAFRLLTFPTMGGVFGDAQRVPAGIDPEWGAAFREMSQPFFELKRRYYGEKK